jgi:hypothetical protein
VNASFSIDRRPQFIDRSTDDSDDVTVVIAMQALRADPHKSINQEDLVKLRDFLHAEMNPKHIITGRETGIVIYNLNQVAYFMEGDVTDGKKSVARERVSRGLKNLKLPHIMKSPLPYPCTGILFSYPSHLVFY